MIYKNNEKRSPNGWFKDPVSGEPIDAQTALIRKIIKQPKEFKMFQGLDVKKLPEFLLSDAILQQ